MRIAEVETDLGGEEAVGESKGSIDIYNNYNDIITIITGIIIIIMM